MNKKNITLNVDNKIGTDETRKKKGRTDETQGEYLKK